MRSRIRNPKRNGQAGFTLVELMVAITVFAIIALAAYAIYDAARWSFKRGSDASDAQQRTRIGFDRMASDIRLAGYDYNSDGDQTPYQDQSDEQVEYLGPTAFLFRANLDYENDQQGREWDESTGPASGTGANSTSAYETSVAYLQANPDAYGFPVVTTANDEIVLYALVKDGVNDSITFKLDTTRPRDSDIEQIGETADAEETIRVCNIALTHDDPPYELQRITFVDTSIGGSGNNCLAERYLTRTPLADDIRRLNFLYYDDSDDDFYCTDPNEDGTCSASNQVPYLEVGGDDDLKSSGDLLGRSARAEIRRVSVELVGMTENPDLRYSNPEETASSSARRHRTTRLIADLNPPNLGKVGQLDIGTVQPTQVQDVSACSGQCAFVRVTWQENPRQEQILGYLVDVYEITCGTTTKTNKLTSKFVTGQDAYDQSGYLYTTFTGDDYLGLLAQARETVANRPCLAVQVTAKNVHGDDGPPSDSNPGSAEYEVTPLDNEPGAPHAEKIYDETRPDAPSELLATGFEIADYDNDSDGVPDTNTGVSPESDNTSDSYPQKNFIRLTWSAPSWTLNEDSNVPVTRLDNTTDPALGQGATSPGCHVEEDDTGLERTPLAEFNNLMSKSEDLDNLESLVPESNKEGRYLIFRSTEASFKPRDYHLIAAIEGTEFVDTTVHYFKTESGEELFRYTEAFPVENCVPYFYRIRAADDCWDGTNPAGDDPDNGDYSHDNLSPFYPPLNSANADDTDQLPAASTADAAVMGYARPQASPMKIESDSFNLDAYDDPNKTFFISFDLPKKDQVADEDLAEGETNHIAIGSVRLYGTHITPDFNVPDSDDQPCANPPCPISGGSIWWYDDIPISTDPTGSNPRYYDDDNDNDPTDVVPLAGDEAGILSERIAHDDEDGDNAGTLTSPASWNVEIPFEDESAYDQSETDRDVSDSGDTSLKFTLDNAAGTWFFKVLAVQCKDTDGESYTQNLGNDWDRGTPSDWIQIPCDFGEGINDSAPGAGDGTVSRNRAPIDNAPSGDVAINGGTCPASLPSQITATVTDDQGDVRACQARLVLQAGISGDTVASGWKFWSDTGQCNEAGTGCPYLSSYYSTNEFCWTDSEVGRLMDQLRGQDVRVTVEVRESIPDTLCIFGSCSVEWYLPCVGTETCPSLITAQECLSQVEQSLGQGFSTFQPVMPQDDFTGAVDPISGEPNGLPDGVADCYQAAEWTWEEACANGPLDITDIEIRWRADTGGTCTGNLLRAYWDYQDSFNPGVLIYEAPNWPDSGTTSGNVQTCDVNEGCSNTASCNDPDPDMDCLFLEEGALGTIRLEFDQDPDGSGNPTCANSMKNAEIQVEIEYSRTQLTGSSQTLTQTFVYSATEAPIPDLCNLCDQDNDGALAQDGVNENGDPCGGNDCDDLDPTVGAAANCCDADADGYERLGSLSDGTPCGNPNKGATCDDKSGSGTPNDCDDTDANVNPGATESLGAGNCADGIDNDCDCATDGSPVEFDLFECRI